ncbi:hypothetical protein ACFLWT_00135 [Chloroflexota bacterium]
MDKILKLGIIIALVITLLLGVMVLTTYSEPGIIYFEVGNGGSLLSIGDFSAVPPLVAENATALAMELFGDYQEKSENFVNQLLGTYLGAKDKDFVLVFNSGGWGWTSLEKSLGWCSIFTGIESQLDDLGYTTLLLNYQRTGDGLKNCLNEVVEMTTGYSLKAKALAQRIEFLTDNIPNLKVVIAGESNGTVICDTTMEVLADNPQVYSIQTGPPFWYTNTILDRTLVVADNGITPDSFSRGDLLTLAGANLRVLFGLSQSEDDSGTTLHYVRAPGHDYWWQYPGVSSEITNFLEQNFGF